LSSAKLGKFRSQGLRVNNRATAMSPVLLSASGNSPAGVNQLQVWIDGKKRYVKWGDQLAKKITLSPEKRRSAVVANEQSGLTQ